MGKVFAPTGTKDYSTYITKIRQSGCDAVYLVLAGDDNNAFLSQAAQYKLGDKVALLAEQLELSAMKAVGDACLGMIVSARYAFSIDNPKNKEFVELWKKEHGGQIPDQFEGEQWQCQQVFEAGIAKAGSIDADKLRPALEDLDHRRHQGQGAHPQVRPPGCPAGLHRQGCEEGRLLASGTGGDRDAAGRQGDAALQQDDLRRLSLPTRSAAASPVTAGGAD